MNKAWIYLRMAWCKTVLAFYRSVRKLLHKRKKPDSFADLSFCPSCHQYAVKDGTCMACGLKEKKRADTL